MNNIQINSFNRIEAVNALIAMKPSFSNHSPNRLSKQDPNKPQLQSIRAVWRNLANRLLDVLISDGSCSSQDQDDIDKSIDELTFLLVSENREDEDDKDTIRSQCADIVKIAGPILQASPGTRAKLDLLINMRKHFLEIPSVPVYKKMKTTDLEETSSDHILETVQQKLDRVDLTEDLERKWELIEEANQLFQSIQDPSQAQQIRMNVMKLELGKKLFFCGTHFPEDLYSRASRTKSIEQRGECLLEADEYIQLVKKSADFFGFKQEELTQLAQIQKKIENALPTEQEINAVWLRQLITLSYDLHGLTNPPKRTLGNGAPLPPLPARKKSEYENLACIRKKLFALESANYTEESEKKTAELHQELLAAAGRIIKKAADLRNKNLLTEVRQFLLSKAIKNVENVKSVEMRGNVVMGSSLHKQPHAVKMQVTFELGIEEPEPRNARRTPAQISIPDTIFEYEHRPLEALIIERLSLCWARLNAILFQQAPVTDATNKTGELSLGGEDLLLDPPEGSAQDLWARLVQIKSDIRIKLFDIYEGKRADKTTRNSQDNEPDETIAEMFDNLYEVGCEMTRLPVFSQEEKAAIAACLDEINAIDEDVALLPDEDDGFLSEGD